MTDAALCAECKALRLLPNTRCTQRMESAWPVHSPDWKGRPGALDRWLLPLLSHSAWEEAFSCEWSTFSCPSSTNGLRLRNPPGFEYVGRGGAIYKHIHLLRGMGPVQWQSFTNNQRYAKVARRSSTERRGQPLKQAERGEKSWEAILPVDKRTNEYSRIRTSHIPFYVIYLSYLFKSSIQSAIHTNPYVNVCVCVNLEKGWVPPLSTHGADIRPQGITETLERNWTFHNHGIKSFLFQA